MIILNYIVNNSNWLIRFSENKAWLYEILISIEGKSVWRNEDEECDVIETVKSIVDDAACNGGFSGISVLLKKRTQNNGEWDNSDAEFPFFSLAGNNVIKWDYISGGK